MRNIILRLLLLFFLIAGAAAADLELVTDGSEGYPGMPMGLRLRAVGEEGVERPRLPAVKGLSFAEAGESRSTMRSFGSGGGKSVTSEYSWRIIPSAAGRYTIPALTLKVGDETLSTDPVEILIKEPGPVEGYHLFLSTEGDTVFPGMPVRLTLKWLFSSEVGRPEFTLPFLSRDDLKVADLSAPPSSGADIYQFQAEGRTLYATQSAEIYKGEQYASLSVSWDIYPQREGRLLLEPVYLAFQRVVKDRYGRKGYAPAVIPSQGLSLEVKALPEELASFPGGILVASDTLDIEAELDQQRVYPGDPLELSLRFKGLVNPSLTDFRGISALGQGLFRAESGSLVSSVEGNEKVVRQTLRMLGDPGGEFPSLTFPYYNMSKGLVERASTPLLPLAVETLAADEEDSQSMDILKAKASDLESIDASAGLSLKGNHRVRELPAFLAALNRQRWGIWSGVLILLVLTLLFPLLVRFLRAARRLKGGEYDNFRRSVMALDSHKRDEGGDDLQAALARVYEAGRCWLKVQGKIEEGSVEAELEKALESLENELWREHSGGLDVQKDIFRAWPDRLKKRSGGRRA